MMQNLKIYILINSKSFIFKNIITLLNIMGIYYSDDGTACTSTLDVRPITFLTSKHKKYTKAAITIQKWWRFTMNKRN